MNAFPELDKKPMVNVAMDYDDNVIKSPMESGLEITRSRFSRVRRQWQVSYSNCLQSDLDALDNFIRSVVFGQAGSFSWRHPGTGEVVTVRFTELPKPVEAGYISNPKLVLLGQVDPQNAQGNSYSFSFKVKEV